MKEHNRGIFMTKTIRRMDLRAAVMDATKLTREAAKIDVSQGYHHRAGKAWDRVAFLTKDNPEEKEMHDDAAENARLEYNRAEEIRRMK